MANDPMACKECRAYYLADRDELVKACSAVSGGHAGTTGWLLRDYLTGYHESGHDEDYAIKAPVVGEGNDAR